MDETSDDALVVKTVLSGHSDSFGLLYDRYVGAVRAACFEATENVVDAQDLAQEVMVFGFQQLRKLEDAGRCGAWILGIARLQGRQWRRSRGRDRHEFRATICETETLSESRDGDELLMVMEAMRTLSEDERTAIHLFNWTPRMLPSRSQ